jgi:hypothetical protein
MPSSRSSGVLQLAPVAQLLHEPLDAAHTLRLIWQLQPLVLFNKLRLLLLLLPTAVLLLLLFLLHPVLLLLLQLLRVVLRTAI